MRFGSVLAILALMSLTPSLPAVAAKDDKLPRCNARQKRPANLYGTVLPTIPDRGLTATAASPATGGVARATPAPQPSPAPFSPTTDLFPPVSAATAPQGVTSQGGKVPAIGAVGGQARPTAALPTSFASC